MALARCRAAEMKSYQQALRANGGSSGSKTATSMASIALIAALLIVPFYAAAEQTHLQLTDKPDEMTVWWITKDSVKSVVEYSKDGSNWLQTTNWDGPQKYQRTDEKHGSYKSGFIHEVILKDLQIGSTNYEYRVNVDSNGSDEEGKASWSKSYNFRTRSNNPDATVKFAAIAEQGEMISTEDGGAGSVLNLLMALRGSFDFLLHAGNMAIANANQTKWDDYGKWMEPLAAQRPVNAAPGSRDAEPGAIGYAGDFVAWNSRWRQGEGRRTQLGDQAALFWHSFDYGAVHFVVLSSEHDNDDMYNWLERDLREANKQVNRLVRPWVVVLLNRPIHNSPNNNPLRQSIAARVEPLLRDYRVQIVLTGHCQNYERTYPMFRKQVTDFSSGTTFEPYITNAFFESQGQNNHGPLYLTLGIGGQKGATCPQRPWSVATPSRLFQGIGLFTATRSQLSFNVVDIAGQSKDSFSMCATRGCTAAPPLPESLPHGGTLTEEQFSAIRPWLGLKPLPPKSSVEPGGLDLPEFPSEAVREDARAEPDFNTAVQVVDEEVLPYLSNRTSETENTEERLPTEGLAPGEPIKDVAMIPEAPENGIRDEIPPASANETVIPISDSGNIFDKVSDTYNNVTAALTENWWVLMLVVAAVVGFVVLAVFGCFVHFYTVTREDKPESSIAGNGTLLLDDLPDMSARSTALSMSMRSAAFSYSSPAKLHGREALWDLDQSENEELEMMAAGFSVVTHALSLRNGSIVSPISGNPKRLTADSDGGSSTRSSRWQPPSSRGPSESASMGKATSTANLRANN